MAFNWRPTNAPIQTRYDDIWFISPRGRPSRRNAVLIDGTGTGKSHIASRLVPNRMRNGVRVRLAFR